MGKRDAKPMVAEDDVQFVRFWNAFPRRVAKKDARIAWATLHPTDAQVDQMVAALAWQSEMPEWVREGGRFVPYPASYLRSERFSDERPQPKAHAISSAVSDPMSAWLNRKKAV